MPEHIELKKISSTPGHQHSGVRFLTLSTLTLVLAACSVGPDYQKPQTATPGAFNDMTPPKDKDGASIALPSEPNPLWWKAFNDPQLDSLVTRAIAGNISLQQAVLRIAGAREQVKQAQGAWLPSVQGNAKVTRQQLGLKGILESSGASDQLNDLSPQASGAIDTATRPVDLYQGSFDASWELDLFGGTRRQVEAANAQTAVFRRTAQRCVSVAGGRSGACLSATARCPKHHGIDSDANRRRPADAEPDAEPAAKRAVAAD